MAELRPVVIKLGGSALPHRDAVLGDLETARAEGFHPVLVHGGGPIISAWLRRIGKEAVFVDGLRVTDSETLEVATMVLAGKVNKELVAVLTLGGTKAFGLSGADGELVRARRLTSPELGFVGEIVRIDPAPLRAVIEAGYVPVIAPIAIGDQGLLNINADTVAGDIAHAIGAELLIFLTDVPGVKDEAGRVVRTLSPEECTAMRGTGAISGGMIPKIDACLVAVRGGARAVIADGADPGAVGLHLHGSTSNGTTIVARTVG